MTPADTIRHADIRLGHPRMPGGLLGQLGPFAILALAGACLWWKWDLVPERFPIHWGIHGEPNGWSTKGTSGFFLMPATAVFTCLMVCALTFLIRHTTRSATAGDRFRMRSNLTVMLLVEYFIATIFGSMFVTFPLMRVWRLVPLAALGILLAGLCGGVAVALTGGINATAGDDESAGGDGTLEAGWKLGGGIYNAPSDPALFVEKRTGLGYTLNYGHPAAWTITALLLAIPLLIALLTIFLHHNR